MKPAALALTIVFIILTLGVVFLLTYLVCRSVSLEKATTNKDAGRGVPGATSDADADIRGGKGGGGKKSSTARGCC